MDETHIKYSVFTVTVGTLMLAIPFFTLVTAVAMNENGSVVEKIFTYLMSLIMALMLFYWIIQFLVPLILRKPAIIISPSGLFIDSIGQEIPWAEIQKTEAKNSAENCIVKIFVKDINKISIQSMPDVKRLVYAFNSMMYTTPFCFSTLALEGTAADIYNAIKSGQNIASFRQPSS